MTADPFAIAPDFVPDPRRARAIDRRMHRELSASLTHVCEASRGQIAFDEVAMAQLIAGLSSGVGHKPSTFGRYYDLVRAIGDDNFASGERLFAELAAAAPAAPGLEVLAIDDPALGEDSARYLRMMNDDPTVDLSFEAPKPADAASFRVRLADALALLDEALPELAGEIRAIVRQIVIAGSDPARKYQFDGGSHYQLWGALFLNHHHAGRVALAEVLAHESAHSLLFGFCTDEALVENEDEERFASPLRVDPRPMDGIYHATYVSARMHWTMARLAESGQLTAAERRFALDAAAADLKNFGAGHGVVAKHGALTGLGRGLMQAARGYIDSVR